MQAISPGLSDAHAPETFACELQVHECLRWRGGDASGLNCPEVLAKEHCAFIV